MKVCVLLVENVQFLKLLIRGKRFLSSCISLRICTSVLIFHIIGRIQSSKFILHAVPFMTLPLGNSKLYIVFWTSIS